ncbi:MAG: hypothetical protein MI824_19100 [Hyphomicrobiales bacterium]|nr:hypothetical protein [Hyphomicrobiales bacterium]
MSKSTTVKDGRGIEWRLTVLDPTTGRFRKERTSPAASNPTIPLRATQIEGTSKDLITEIPADQDTAHFMWSWLVSHARPNSKQRAIELLQNQFREARPCEREKAAELCFGP